MTFQSLFCTFCPGMRTSLAAYALRGLPAGHDILNTIIKLQEFIDSIDFESNKWGRYHRPPPTTKLSFLLVRAKRVVFVLN